MLAIRQIGLVPYPSGLIEQARAAAEVRDGPSRGVVLVTRHPPSITLGRRADPAELHLSRWDRRALGIDLYHVDRGGGATYHYPGQAVVYPVLHLGRLGLTVAGLLDALSGALGALLLDHGVRGTWDPERPGMYVGGAKVASVGLHVRGEVTTHGLALNVGPGCDGFRHIDPCKVRGLPVTSLAHLIGYEPDPDAVGLDLGRRIAAAL